MKRVVLGVAVALLAPSAFAQTDASSLYQVFQKLQGRWADGRSVSLTYVVNEDGVRLEGQSCRPDANAKAPEDCRAIDEGYYIDRTRLLHDYPNFGVKPVEIVEMTATKIVLAEQNPVMANRAQIITQEFINDGRTLRFLVEQRVNGRAEPKLRHEFLLDRVY